MNRKTSATPGDPDQLPLGSDPTRSKAPLIVWGVLYGVWFVVLFWMAYKHVGL